MKPKKGTRTLVSLERPYVALGEPGSLAPKGTDIVLSVKEDDYEVLVPLTYDDFLSIYDDMTEVRRWLLSRIADAQRGQTRTQAQGGEPTRSALSKAGFKIVR